MCPQVLSVQRTSQILTTTRALLTAGGITAVTIEAVSKQTGIAKTTLYRRWANAEQLAIIACLDVMRDVAPIPKHGTFAHRMEAVLLGAVRFMRSKHGGWLRQALGAAQNHKLVLQAIQEDFLAERRAEARKFLDEARVRGEASFENVEVALDIMAGSLYHRLMMGHLPLTDAFARQHALLVVKALSPEL